MEHFGGVFRSYSEAAVVVSAGFSPGLWTSRHGNCRRMGAALGRKFGGRGICSARELIGPADIVGFSTDGNVLFGGGSWHSGQDVGKPTR